VGIRYSCGVLTVSDKGARGERTDTSGPAICDMLATAGFELAVTGMVPDQQEGIAAVLLEWADRRVVDLIVTTGGTGVAPSDVTPEATRPLLDREVPGISEAMRQASLAITARAMLSRGVAGIRGKTLIINLPGSERAARENLATVLAVLPHAIAKIKGDPGDCGRS